MRRLRLSRVESAKQNFSLNLSPHLSLTQAGAIFACCVTLDKGLNSLGLSVLIREMVLETEERIRQEVGGELNLLWCNGETSRVGVNRPGLYWAWCYENWRWCV